MRIWISATCRSKSRAINDWPSSLIQCILVSTRLRRWYPLQRRHRVRPRYRCALTASLRAIAPARPSPTQAAAASSGRTSCLAKRHAKQHLQRQTSLNGGITELLRPTALAAWWRCPNHFRIKPDRQRSTLLQAVIVRRPILGLVLRMGPTAHLTQLSRWIHTVNPISPFLQQSSVRICRFGRKITIIENLLK